jgi:hypothetical protein
MTRREFKALEVNIDDVIAEAVNHMADESDVRWSIGMALQELYWDKGWEDVQEHLITLYNEQSKQVNRS